MLAKASHWLLKAERAGGVLRSQAERVLSSKYWRATKSIGEAVHREILPKLVGFNGQALAKPFPWMLRVDVGVQVGALADIESLGDWPIGEPTFFLNEMVTKDAPTPWPTLLPPTVRMHSCAHAAATSRPPLKSIVHLIVMCLLRRSPRHSTCTQNSRTPKTSWHCSPAAALRPRRTLLG